MLFDGLVEPTKGWKFGKYTENLLGIMEAEYDLYVLPLLVKSENSYIPSSITANKFGLPIVFNRVYNQVDLDYPLDGPANYRPQGSNDKSAIEVELTGGNSTFTKRVLKDVVKRLPNVFKK